MTTHSNDWIDAPIDMTIVRGACELERTARGAIAHRLPAWARAQCADPQLAMAESQPSGVRLVFTTRATAIELDVQPTRYVYRGLPPRPPGVYDLLVDGQLTSQGRASDATVVTIDIANGATSTHTAAPATLRFSNLPAHDKRVEIWLPHNEHTALVALRANRPILLPVDHAARPRWLHYGSSISHGSNAESPTAIWPVVAASLGKVDLTNLGLGGSALLDPFIARFVRDQPADVISAKIGINLVNHDLMRQRAFGPAVHGFIDTIRDGHPCTPLYIVSPICCPIHETTPGPGAFDPTALAAGKMSFLATGDPADIRTGKLTLTVIRDALRQIVDQRAASDPNLHYVDGLALYGARDVDELPLPDALHPEGAAHRRIGERFAQRVFAMNTDAP